MTKSWLARLIRIIYDHRTHVVYAYDKSRQGDGRMDPNVAVYDGVNTPPTQVIRLLQSVTSCWGFALLYRRMLRNGGKLLVMRNENCLMAYGWIQGWQPFRRRYGWLAQDAMMLGFYWTNPAYRGQGLYGRLLAHSIAVCENRIRIPLIIMTNPANLASQRGIEKAGFSKLGVFDTVDVLFRLMNRHSIVEGSTTLEQYALQNAAKQPRHYL